MTLNTRFDNNSFRNSYSHFNEENAVWVALPQYQLALFRPSCAEEVVAFTVLGLDRRTGGKHASI